MGKERGELASRFAAGTGHERNKFAVESSFANQQPAGIGRAPSRPSRHRRQARAAGSEFTIDAQVVINTRERGFNGGGSGSRSMG